MLMRQEKVYRVGIRVVEGIGIITYNGVISVGFVRTTVADRLIFVVLIKHFYAGFDEGFDKVKGFITVLIL